MKILGSSFIISLLLIVIPLFIPTNNAYAETVVVPWGKITLKEGHIGKVVINIDTTLYRLDKNTLTSVRTLKKGNEFGVYSKKVDPELGVLYGLGSNQYVRESKNITYQTPSKDKKEIAGKERIWITSDYFYDKNGNREQEVKNLTEAIIIESIKNEMAPYDLKLKVKIGTRYYFIDYIDTRWTEDSYLTQNPFKKYKFKSSIWKDIKERKVSLGMNTTMVRLAWGVPDDINESGGSFGTYAQWVYGDPLDDASYLYFDNGILTSWQDF